MFSCLSITLDHVMPSPVEIDGLPSLVALKCFSNLGGIFAPRHRLLLTVHNNQKLTSKYSIDSHDKQVNKLEKTVCPT